MPELAHRTQTQQQQKKIDIKTHPCVAAGLAHVHAFGIHATSS